MLCLNSILRDWHRVYLPSGAKLVEAQGFTQAAKEYDEAGFHVVDGYFILEPNSQAKVKYTYTVPFQASEYKLNIWQQGGTDPTTYLIDVNGNEQEVVISKDTKVTGKFE